MGLRGFASCLALALCGSAQAQTTAAANTTNGSTTTEAAGTTHIYVTSQTCPLDPQSTDERGDGCPCRVTSNHYRHARGTDGTDGTDGADGDGHGDGHGDDGVLPVEAVLDRSRKSYNAYYGYNSNSKYNYKYQSGCDPLTRAGCSSYYYRGYRSYRGSRGPSYSTSECENDCCIEGACGSDKECKALLIWGYIIGFMCLACCIGGCCFLCYMIFANPHQQQQHARVIPMQTAQLQPVAPGHHQQPPVSYGQPVAYGQPVQQQHAPPPAYNQGPAAPPYHAKPYNAQPVQSDGTAYPDPAQGPPPAESSV